ncbi:MAG: right-handed parallel beta-helix repeat-containing protein [Deltaproteobacteria bacterium]|nr:right-handed parallel beta-helix repeat-containing protein [Deltaproteobacteria bacterium]
MLPFYFFLIVTLLLHVPVAQAKIKPAPGDIVLTGTWRPVSGTPPIDCQGGKIRAEKPYKLNGDPHRHRIPSKPEVLIYLKDVYNVEIKNCDLSGGDTAIFIVGGGGHKITNNKITAINGVQIFSSSDNLIQDNLIRYGDAGVLVRMNSDRNQVIQNTVQLSEALAEGGPAVGAYSSPGDAVVNIFIEGELTQVLNDAHTLEDLQIKDNKMDLRGGGPGPDDDGFMGIALNGRTEGGRALNNTIEGGIFAITSWGYEKFLPVIIPGWCSEDATRRCNPPGWGDGDDCFMRGFDRKSKGRCEGTVFLWGETTEVLDSQFIGNTISGAIVCLSAYLAPTSLIASNDASGCTIGIEIGDYMLESGKVLGNIVQDSGLAFSIFNALGLHAGAEISYNDFSGYETAVAAQQVLCDANECSFEPDPNGYQLETVLSRNHWGAHCEPPGLPPTVATPESYGFPVAEMYRNDSPEDFGPFCN